MNFEIIGNSHAATLAGAPPCGNKVLKQREKPHGRGYTEINPDYPFRAWYLGPVLAYNFFDNHLQKIYQVISEHPDIFNNKNSMILLAVGEIDCRAHLPKHVSHQKSEFDVVENCVIRYHKAIENIINNGYNVGVLGAFPSLSDQTLKKLMTPDVMRDNVAGNTELRNSITKSWDKFHGDICKKQKIPYISIYQSLIDEKGYTKEEYFSDFIHLSYDKTIDLWIKSFKQARLL